MPPLAVLAYDQVEELRVRTLDVVKLAFECRILDTVGRHDDDFIQEGFNQRKGLHAKTRFLQQVGGEQIQTAESADQKSPSGGDPTHLL